MHLLFIANYCYQKKGCIGLWLTAKGEEKVLAAPVIGAALFCNS
jgi:hypothetical protein